MMVKQFRLTALATVAAGLFTATAWGHPTPYGDTYTFSGENFPNSFGVVKEPETGEIMTFPGAPITLRFDGIAETAGQMRVNERAVVWPGKSGLVGENPAADPGEEILPLIEWENAGEVLEFSFDTLNGQWISSAPALNSSFTLAGIDWQHALNDATPQFYRTGFYFYFTNNGVPLTGMEFTTDDAVYVGPHPFDDSVPEVAYIGYSLGQVDDVTDAYPGGTDFNAGTRQLRADASWALLQAALSLPPATGNGLRVGYLVDIATTIDATSGDFNGDGDVDTIDYDILRGSFQQPGGFADGDINFDGKVDLADFVDFKKSYQLANGQPLQSVPEPGTFALVLLVFGAAAGYRYRGALRHVGRASAATAVLLTSAAAAFGQGEYIWVPAGPAAANWNVDNNWNPALIPSQEAANGAAEFAIINNGGRAYIDANLPKGSTDDITGLTLGRDDGFSGALEIRSGGSLAVIQSGNEHGRAEIGAAGTGVLDVLPGGAFSAYSLGLGGVNSQINASGNASIVVETTADLAQTTKISGPSVNFTAAAVNLSGTLIADITSGAHSPILVSGKANMRQAKLKVQFTGHTPAFGNEFAIIDATSLAGSFTTLDVSAAPSLAEGLEYRLAYNDDDATVNLKVDNTLILAVDPNSGASAITNVVGASISLDGYSILSAGGHLSTAWAGLGASDASWLDASPTVNALSELNIGAGTAVNVGASLSLGTILSGALAEVDRDLVFEYSANGELRHGIVKYGSISAPGQEGDTDNDGDVDLDDLNAVRNNFGAVGPVGGTPGDAYPFHGTVNLDDLNGVRNNFGAMPGSVAVPEPSTWALALLGVAGLALVRRRQAA